MDQSSIERALTSLIPAHNGPLPSKLVERATSLLAQSRSKASNLKAEEEIARVYVCANLACERLKQTLNLPKIDPRPPCPPRVYKKLYKYLEQVLPASHRSRPLRASPPTTGDSTLSSAKTHQEYNSSKSHSGSSSSRRQPAAFNSVKTSSQPSTTLIAKPNNDAAHFQRVSPYGDYPEWDVPVWVRPLLNHLCTHVFRPQATAYVLLGLRAVMTLPAPSSANRPPASREKNNHTDKIPALIIALCVYVATRLSGVPLNQETLDAQRKASLAVLERPEFAANASIQKVHPKDIDDWMWELSEKGWMDQEWYKKVPLGNDPALLAREIGGVAEGLDFGEDMDIDDDDAMTITRPAGAGRSRDMHPTSARKVVPLGGLGTMIQSRVDYLSEEKRAEYLEWKERIGKRVAEIERARGKNSNASSASLRMPIS